MTHASLAKSRSRTKSVAREAANTRVSTGALAVFGTLSTLTGLWAVACLVGALIATGGPLALTSAWISAVTGG
jgi:fatty acid desaturase